MEPTFFATAQDLRAWLENHAARGTELTSCARQEK
jgi:hypothetical protein